MTAQSRGNITYTIKRCRETCLLLLVVSIALLDSFKSFGSGQEEFSWKMEQYHDFVEQHDVEEFLGASALFPYGDAPISKDAIIFEYSYGDYDRDGSMELLIKGQELGENTKIALLDLINGQVECVFADWGEVLGIYYDSLSNQSYLAIIEGNADGNNEIFRIGLYDSSWNSFVLASHFKSNEKEINLDRNGNNITETDYRAVEDRVRRASHQIYPDYEYGWSYGATKTELLLSMEDEIAGGDHQDLYWFGNNGTYGGSFLEKTDPVFTPDEVDGSVSANSWYVITSTYNKGIAVHPIPKKESEVIGRIAYQQEFYVVSKYNNYGFTTYNGVSGWINLDYAEQQGGESRTQEIQIYPSSQAAADVTDTMPEEYYIFPDSDTRIISENEGGTSELPGNDSRAQEAVYAYKSFLEQYDGYIPGNEDLFALVYIDNDDIPELAFVDGSLAHAVGVELFGYLNGSVVLIGMAGSSGTSYFCPYQNIVRGTYMGQGTYSAYYQSITAGSMTEIANYSYSFNDDFDIDVIERTGDAYYHQYSWTEISVTTTYSVSTVNLEKLGTEPDAFVLG